MANYSLFIIKKGNYSLIIIPHPDPPACLIVDSVIVDGCGFLFKLLGCVKALDSLATLA